MAGPLNVEDDDVYYEVEAIVDSRKKGNRVEYLVKWRGYGPLWNSWEPVENLYCPSLIAEFLRQTRDVDPPASIASQAACAPLQKRARSKRRDSAGTLHLPSSHLAVDAGPGVDSSSATSPRSSKPAADTQPGGATPSRSPATWNSPNAIAKQRFLDMMNGFGAAPIDFENNVDDTAPPAYFCCVDRLLYREGVPVPDLSFLIGCECGPMGCGSASASSCAGPAASAGTCTCLSQNNESGPVYDGEGRLLIESGPIYECNSKCSCGPTCPNRVVQRGRQVPLTIARFPAGKGWGVRATKAIPAGTFIDLYLGEVVTAAEANQRFLQATGDEGSYLFDLDFNYEVGTESEFTVDAYRFGNITHFINHSCAPNLRVHPCFIDSWDLRLHHLAFFSSRHIAEGEELCFDYLGNAAAPSNASGSSQHRRLVCHCGTAQCRGFVY